MHPAETEPAGRLLQQDEEIARLLQAVRHIAVVGVSRDPAKPSHQVARYLIAEGYDVIPVNPSLDVWEGRRCFPSAQAIPERVDLVDLFRPSEAIPPHVEDAIAAGARAVWMQLGIRHDAAARRALEAGLDVVVDRCAKIEHRRLLRRAPSGGTA
ncbi:CoA-binding protein [Limnochorda pilosa]|uniref:CoA-binding protein n=2 Tax=Limnochorda pilosa TaxID=1555112 RepID=A0A0K2SJ04_LIMPI|nr:CoA-binding protein [Limnochorda pilosa]